MHTRSAARWGCVNIGGHIPQVHPKGKGSGRAVLHCPVRWGIICRVEDPRVFRPTPRLAEYAGLAGPPQGAYLTVASLFESWHHNKQRKRLNVALW